MKYFDNYKKPEGKLGGMIAKSMNKEHTPVSLWGLKHIDINPEDMILDVGCGGGINLRRMQEKAYNGHVIGLEKKKKSVEISSKVNEDLIKEGKVEVIQGDVQDLKFEDETFDKVTAFETIYFWPGLAHCFGEVRRVLKPGGKFLIGLESNGDSSMVMKFFGTVIDMTNYNDSEVIKALQEAGFEDIVFYSRDAKNNKQNVREISSEGLKKYSIDDDLDKGSYTERFVQWATFVATK